jgi:hypothetical protein
MQGIGLGTFIIWAKLAINQGVFHAGFGDISFVYNIYCKCSSQFCE